MAFRDRATDVVSAARDRNLTVVAAGLAYYAFNALLLVLVLAVVALTRTGYVSAALSTLAATVGVDPDSVRVVASNIDESAGVLRVAGLAAVLLSWNGLRMGDSIAQVFSSLYGERDSGRLGRAVDVVVVVLTWAVAVALVVPLALLFSAVSSYGILVVTWPFLLFGGLVVAFLPMYVVFPDGVSVRHALPGAALAAGAWTLSSVVLWAYASASASVQFYGVVGFLLLFLTWLYLGGLVILFGGVVNAVLAGDLTDDD